MSKFPGEESEPQETNLRFIRRSRPRLRDGDIIRMGLGDGRELVGRIAVASAVSRTGRRALSSIPGATVLEVFRPGTTVQRAKEIADRSEDLIYPVHTNRLGFSRGGIMEVADRIEPLPGWWPPPMQFWHQFGGLAFSLTGEEVLGATPENSGKLRLYSYLAIDDLISDALGIPRAYEEGA